jgi:hypothetical protein
MCLDSTLSGNFPSRENSLYGGRSLLNQ